MADNKNTTDAKSAARRPLVPKDTFNFIDEVASVNRRARSLTRVVLALSVGLVLIVSVVGLNANRQVASDQAALDEVTNQRIVADKQVRDLTGGADDLPSHITKRREQLGSLLATDTDAGALVMSVLSTTPSGVAVNSISLSGVVTPDTAAGEPPKPATDEATPTAPNVPRTITITATAPNFDTPIAWRNTLSTLGYLTELKVDPRSGSNGVEVTVTATLANGELQTRRNAITTLVGPVTGSAPAPSEGGK